MTRAGQITEHRAATLSTKLRELMKSMQGYSTEFICDRRPAYCQPDQQCQGHHECSIRKCIKIVNFKLGNEIRKVN